MVAEMLIPIARVDLEGWLLVDSLELFLAILRVTPGSRAE